MINSPDLKSLLEIIVSGSAIVALIISIISILQSGRFKKDERHSKRAYVAPVSKPGYLKLPSKSH